MKVISVLLLMCALPGWMLAQAPLDREVQLTGTSLSVGEVLSQITKQSGVSFSYNPKKVDVSSPLNLAAGKLTIAGFLDQLEKQVNINAELVEKQVVLTARKPSALEETRHTYSGYVKDVATGEVLIGSTVVLEESHAGVVANAYGFFSLTLPPGRYTARVSFIGYKPLVKTVTLSTTIQETIFLEEMPPVLTPIQVNDVLPLDLEEVQTSKLNIRPAAVAERPALFGEMDVIKSLESVPGIRLHSDGSTFYYVRGGNRDQNLLLIDDAPVYNPSHMLGIFSTVIPDAVSDLTLYKGEMPASFGGRLSSVLDVHTRKGNDQRRQVWGNVGLLSTKLGIEGPLKKGASSFLITARASRLQWLLALADKNLKQFYFYDLTGKVNFKLNDRNRLFFSFYSGADHYFSSNSGIQWSNFAGTLRWNHQFNSRLFANTTFSGSVYDYSLYVDVAKDTRWNSHIGQVNLKSDFSYFINPQHTLTFGGGVTGYNFNPGNLLSSVSLSPPRVSVRNSSEWALYLNDERQVADHWKIQYGIRGSIWSNSGPAFEFQFDQNHRPVDTLVFQPGQRYQPYARLEPRASVQFSATPKSSWKWNVARNTQNLHLISNSISPFTSLEVWLPSSINILPETSWQTSVGYNRELPKGFIWTIEGYGKKMNHLIDYAPHAPTLLNPLLEAELRFGTGTAYGVETLLKRDVGRLRGWLGYSYARAFRTFDAIDNGKTFNAFSDRPHQANVMVSYDVSRRWTMGLTWNYSTGAPFSAPVSFYQFNGEDVPVYGLKNNARLPNYHRLDFSATCQLNKNPENRFKHSLTFSVYNLYGQKNALFVNFNKQQEADNNFRIPANLQTANYSLSQLYLFQFTPSISYNFKWL